MAGTITRDMPTGEIVRNALTQAGTGGTATVTRRGPPITVSFNPSMTNTATAGIAWINPEASTILVTRFAYRINGSAGTGTLNIALSSDGTGSGNGLIAAGTLTAGYHYGLAGTGSAAGLAATEFLVGPGGSGTNNSIVGIFGDTATSTAGTFSVYVTYYVA